MFKKTKAAANFRRKASASSDEDAQTAATGRQKSPKAGAPLKVVTLAPSIAVSYELEDEDGDGDTEFQVKKTSASRKMVKLRQMADSEKRSIDRPKSDRMHRGLKSAGKVGTDMKPKLESTVSSGDETVDDASPPLPSPPQLTHTDSVKTVHHTQIPIAVVDDDDNDGDASMVDATIHKFSLKPRIKDVFNRGGKGTAIPDAEDVYRARKAREQARGGEVIQLKPLDDTQRYAKNKSRLLREDDNDASDQESEDDLGGEGVRGFYSHKVHGQEDANERRYYRNEFLAHEQGDSDDARRSDASENEFDRFEREQIRKGVTALQMNTLKEHEQLLKRRALRKQLKNEQRMPQSNGNNEHGRNVYSMGNTLKHRTNQPSTDGGDNMDVDVDDEDVQHSATASAGGRNVKIGGQIPVQLAPVASLDEILMKMSTRIAEADNMLSQRAVDMQKMDDQIEDVETQLLQLKVQRPLLQHKFQLYQEMTAFIRDLIDCFCEKMPKIIDAEQRWLALLASQCEFRMRRRRQDVKDQYEQCTASASAASGKQLPPPPMPDAERQMRTAEREARRARRRQAREKAAVSARPVDPHHDGMSSDDELTPSRQAMFAKEVDDVRRLAATMFDDVNDEYSQVGAILDRFARWMLVDRQSYEDAFIALCVPKLIAPLVHTLIIGQCPLWADYTPLLSQTWLMRVCAVGIDEQTGRDMLRTHDDDNIDDQSSTSEHTDMVLMAPMIVEKCIVPKLTDIVSRAFDPLSTSECTRLARTLHEVLCTLGVTIDVADSKPVHTLYTQLMERIRRTLEDDLFMPIYSREALDNTASGARAFLERQFWTAMKALNNIALLAPVLSRYAVSELILDGVVNRHLVFGLQTAAANLADPGTIDKCRTLTDTLSKVLFAKTSTTMDVSVALPSQLDTHRRAQIEPLAKLIARIGDALLKQPGGAPQQYSQLRRLCDMLVSIDAQNYADSLKAKIK